MGLRARSDSWVRPDGDTGGVGGREGHEGCGIQGGHYRSNTGRVVRSEYAWGRVKTYNSAPLTAVVKQNPVRINREMCQEPRRLIYDWLRSTGKLCAGK